MGSRTIDVLLGTSSPRYEREVGHDRGVLRHATGRWRRSLGRGRPTVLKVDIRPGVNEELTRKVESLEQELAAL